MRRRMFLAGAGTALGVATAGCLDGLGDGPLRFEAEEARVTASAAAEAGYDLAEVVDLPVERTFDVGDEQRTVEVINRVARYEKYLEGVSDDRPAAVFAAVSTPQVEVLGTTVNPVDRLPPEDVAERLRDRYSEVQHLEAVGESSVTVLGAETTQTRFEATVELEGGDELDAYVHVSDPVESGDDFVLGVGGYPQQVPEEGQRIETLLEGIEHPVDRTTETDA